jgi:hypothetical protein
LVPYGTLAEVKNHCENMNLRGSEHRKVRVSDGLEVRRHHHGSWVHGTRSIDEPGEGCTRLAHGCQGRRGVAHCLVGFQGEVVERAGADNLVARTILVVVIIHDELCMVMGE